MYAASQLSHNWLIKQAINSKVRERLSTFGGRVLDLGCGTRPFEPDILQYADEYIGVDWGNTLHDSKANIVADLNKPIPIRNESVDHVVSFEVMEHLHEPQMMLCEAFRVLKKGGAITVSTPFQWRIHEAPWDYCRYTCFGLRHLLEKAGFVEIQVQPTTGFWSMWFLKLNYQTLKLIRGPRWVRRFTRTTLIPLWWVNQHLSYWLDKHWPEDGETAGYFVRARKP